MDYALLIFIKNPLPGRVKTRLARTVGDEKALRIYRFLLEKTRAAALEADASRWLFYSDRIEPEDEWQEPAFAKAVQAGDDLGARMEQAFRQVFAAGAAKAVIIGSDCPDLDGGTLDRAFAALDRADFVLGPTPDGGYYLLGMRAPAPSLFQNIAWSTETVCAQTLEQIQKLERTVILMPELSDIDTETDWEDFCRRRGIVF